MSALSEGARQRGLIAAISCTTIAAVGIGASIPLLSIAMEQQSFAGWLIGLNTSMSFMAALAVMPFTPLLLMRFGALRLMIACALGEAVLSICYWGVPSVWFWFPLRALGGASLAIFFTIGEAWVNQYAKESWRGRTLAFYVTSVACGITLGPFLLQLTGFVGFLPWGTVGVIFLLSSLPLLLAKGLPALFSKGGLSRPSDFIRLLGVFPLVTLAACLYGGLETLGFNLLPVYGVRAGLEAETAALLVSVLGAGMIGCQLPIGILADRTSPLKVLLVCALLTALSGAIIPLASGSAGLLMGAIFCLGAASGGIYTLALVLVGVRYSGGALAAMNAMIVFCYNIGGLFAAPVGGLAMDVWDPHGLAVVICLVGLVIGVGGLWGRLGRERA